MAIKRDSKELWQRCSVTNTRFLCKIKWVIVVSRGCTSICYFLTVSLKFVLKFWDTLLTNKWTLNAATWLHTFQSNRWKWNTFGKPILLLPKLYIPTNTGMFIFKITKASILNIFLFCCNQQFSEATLKTYFSQLFSR